MQSLTNSGPLQQTKIKNIETLFCPALAYSSGRLIQARHRQAVREQRLSAAILFCEHPNLITAGIRSTLSANHHAQHKIYHTQRGGELTFHGPGQLVVYPSVLLRRSISVRKFVTLGLSSIAECLRHYEINPEINLSQKHAGLWLNSKKIGAVGIKVKNGISDHGFSLNLTADLSPFQDISLCGLEPGTNSTVLNETGKSISSIEIAQLLSPMLIEAFLRK
ncbi:lipoyl(octanoyl) transferase LipB [bacterium]|nr:lipoyl(octanoyl) transferase LipB [bacterium]